MFLPFFLVKKKKKKNRFGYVDDDFVAAFFCDIVIWTVEILGPKCWGYGTYFSGYVSWKIHAWCEGYYQDLTWG